MPRSTREAACASASLRTHCARTLGSRRMRGSAWNSASPYPCSGIWACRARLTARPDEPLFCWEAHRAALGGGDVLLLANARNRFAAFACMQPGDWRDWERRGRGVAHLACSLRVRRGFDRRVPVLRRDSGRDAHARPASRRVHERAGGQAAAAPACPPSDEGEPFPHELCRLANEHMACKAAGFEGLGRPAERFAADLARLGIGRAR